MMSQARPSYRRTVAVVSLVLGPLLMSVGDLMHSEEHTDAAEQAAVIVEPASRWHGAHLLLFFGLLVLVPGILALTDLATERQPAAGYAARVLMFTGATAFGGVVVVEMLIVRYVADGADVTAATRLLEAFRSGAVLGAVMLGAAAFFAGVATFALPLARATDGLR